jgi:lipid-binding SYLF domain-containing protein
MSRYFVTFLVVFGVATLGAQNKEQDRLENCGVVLEEVLNVPDNIPQQLLEKARCVIVIPSMMKVAVGFGGSYGRGAMVCRAGKSFDGTWGAPAMYALEGGSFGLQLGGEATDLVLLVMNARGVERAAQQQRQARGERLCRGRAQGTHRGSIDRRDAARRDPELLQVARSVRRHIALRHLASPRRRRQ